ncbi:DNA primase [Lutibacter sp. B2]|nr:DNA primase [Lutibacter sp. B2]
MNINFSESLIDEIKARNDIVGIISQYVPLKQTGHNYQGLCPFHNEKTPSFIVSNDRQLYHCFGCGQAGDVIEFIMKMEHVDFVDALRLLGEKVGINIEEEGVSKEQKELISEKNDIYQMNRDAAIFYYKNLMNQPNEALNYLYKRGLDVKTIKKFGLGYALNEWQSLKNYLLEKGYSQQSIHNAGLITEKNNRFYDRFRNRIIFPIINTTGKVIGFGARAMDDSIPKYLNSPQTLVFNKSYNLFGLNFAKKEITSKKEMIVVEGYMDVISLYQHEIKNVVASLGTALTKGQGQLLKRYADKAFIAYDSDEAGQAATLKGMEILTESECQVRVVSLSDGKDPDELIRKRGKQVFLEDINKALLLVDYKIMLAKKENDLTTTEGKIKFVQSITKIVKQLKSPVEIDAYIKKISLDSQISVDAINREIYGNYKFENKTNNKKFGDNNSKYIRNKDRNTNKESIKPEKPLNKSGYLEAEMSLLKMIINSKDIFYEIKDIFSYENFISESNKKIAKIIYELYSKYGEIDNAYILRELDIDDIVIYKEINDRIIPQENIQKAVMDYLDTIKKYNLMQEKKKIEINIKSLECIKNKSQEQIVRINELCINHQKVTKELKKL